MGIDPHTISTTTTTQKMVQMGTVSMGLFPNAPIKKTTYKVTFPSSFTSVPTITLGLAKLDAEKEHNYRIAVIAIDVTRKDFVIQATTWYDSITWGIKVTWVSVILFKLNYIGARRRSSSWSGSSSRRWGVIDD